MVNQSKNLPIAPLSEPLPPAPSALHLVRCPNCGSIAERTKPDSEHTRTECHSCDYLLIVHSVTGKVVEAYAPGISNGGRSGGRITVQSGFEYWREAIGIRPLATKI